MSQLLMVFDANLRLGTIKRAFLHKTPYSGYMAKNLLQQRITQSWEPRRVTIPAYVKSDGTVVSKERRTRKPYTSSMTELADKCGVDISTLYRFLASPHFENDRMLMEVHKQLNWQTRGVNDELDVPLEETIDLMTLVRQADAAEDMIEEQNKRAGKFGDPSQTFIAEISELLKKYTEELGDEDLAIEKTNEAIAKKLFEFTLTRQSMMDSSKDYEQLMKTNDTLREQNVAYLDQLNNQMNLLERMNKLLSDQENRIQQLHKDRDELSHMLAKKKHELAEAEAIIKHMQMMQEVDLP